MFSVFFFLPEPLPCSQTATMNTQAKQTQRIHWRDKDEMALLKKGAESSVGAYTSAFASWANRWRALQWQEERQERQRHSRVNIRKICLTSQFSCLM